MSGKRSRDKGARRERELVHAYMDITGVFAERVPLSGAMGTYKGDLALKIGPLDWIAEVKSRANGFKQIYNWLGQNDLLHIKADHQEHLVVIPWRHWKNICKTLGTVRYESEI